MRLLRWTLPLGVLLLIAQMIPGQTGSPAPEPYAQTHILAAPVVCPSPEAFACAADAWTFALPSAAGLTAMVVEIDVADSPPLGLDFARFHVSIRAPGMNASEAYVFSQDWGDPPAQFWGDFDGGAPGAWRFEVIAAQKLPGAYHLLPALEARVGVTFAYHGYELPDGYRIFEEASDSANFQTLLGNLGVSDAKVPCASTSLTMAVNGRIVSGAC